MQLLCVSPDNFNVDAASDDQLSGDHVAIQLLVQAPSFLHSESSSNRKLENKN
jgi:hypothetical protein